MRRRRRRFAIVLLTFPVLGATALAAPAPITIAAKVVQSTSNGSRMVRLTGQVASGNAGERVDVLVKECRSRFFRVVGGAQTTTGVTYEAQVYLDVRGTYVARWRGNKSPGVTATPMMRILAPAKTARPCFSAGVSEVFQS